jgi:hypothetical protein
MNMSTKTVGFGVWQNNYSKRILYIKDGHRPDEKECTHLENRGQWYPVFARSRLNLRRFGQSTYTPYGAVGIPSEAWMRGTDWAEMANDALATTAQELWGE